MSRDVDAEVAVEGVAVNRSAGYRSSILAPEVNAVMVVSVGRGIPVGEIMKVVVVNAIAANFAEGTRSDAVIDVIDIGILQREIAAVTSDGPGSVMTGDVVHGEMIGEMLVDAIDRMSRRKIRGRGADI